MRLTKHISLPADRAFGGSDTLTTSYILSQAIRHIETLEENFDLIFCGKTGH